MLFLDIFNLKIDFYRKENTKTYFEFTFENCYKFWRSSENDYNTFPDPSSD